MPKKADRKGYRVITVEAPESVADAIGAAAREAGESFTVFVMRAAAKRAKVPYAAPTRGRPKKDQVG